MSKLWLVARKELRAMVRTTGYRIATVAMPLLFVLLLLVPVVMVRLIDTASEGQTVGLVAAGPLLPAIRAELASHGITVEEAAEESVLAQRVRAGDVDGYVVFPPDALAAQQLRYVIGETVYVARNTLVADAVGRAVVQRRLELEGMDPARVTALTRLPRLQQLVLAEEGEIERDLVAALVLLTLFVAVLYSMLAMYGHALGQSVLSEKTGKTAEIMLSSVPPFALLAGKLLGKVLAGVLQCLAWLVISLPVVAALGPHLDLSVVPFLQPGNLLALMGFFGLGFLLYAAPYAIAGAVATDEDNFSILLWPVSVIELGQFALALTLLTGPESPLAVALSLIPFTAPTFMLLRVVVGDPGAVEVAVAVTGTLLLTVAGVWAAAKVFRLGILLTGKKGTFAEIVRLLRA